MTTTTTPEGAGEFPPLPSTPHFSALGPGDLYTSEHMHAYLTADRKDRQLAACNFCLEQAAEARDALRAQAAEGGKEKAGPFSLAPFTTPDADLNRLLDATVWLAKGPAHNNMDTGLDWYEGLQIVLARLAGAAPPEAAEGEQSAAQAAPRCYVHRDTLQRLQHYEHRSPDDSDFIVRYPNGFPNWVPADIREQYIPLFLAATPAPAHPLPVASKMEVDAWRRSLLVWREAGISELIEDRAGLKQCLSNAARLLLEHPALAHAAPAGETNGAAS